MNKLLVAIRATSVVIDSTAFENGVSYFLYCVRISEGYQPDMMVWVFQFNTNNNVFQLS